MKSLETLLCIAILTSLIAVAGCGGSTDPGAGIPKEKLAPPSTDLGNDPEYAKKFGGKKK